MPPDATRSVALLGPTNTGKTHKAVERMLEHRSGMLGLPLRLLAREIYDRVSARVGEDRVALITGEEKRVPARPDYFICTTEAMPLTREVDFLAVDEIQLATHDERGHVFTDRLLHARGRLETWFMGAATMRDVLEKLVPAARPEQHPRLSRLSYAGATKLSRVRPRSALVAFSLRELYELAGRLRSLRGGTAVVLGALSPRARNAQVAMFQAGEVDTLVATDAIGMGLNLDLEHVVFASLRKFDGQRARALESSEVAQIAGRAGRYLRDGTFGSLLPLEFERELAERVETHRFEPVRRVRFRNSELDYASPRALRESLMRPPPAPWLASVPNAEDLRALDALLRDSEVLAACASPERVALLWEICQIPDFRGILFEVHVDLLRSLFRRLRSGPLSVDYLRGEFEDFRETSGDADVLMARIARLRTWAFVTNQPAWVTHAPELQAELVALEDRLSDALHEALVERFVERRGRTRTARARERSALAPAPSESEDGFRPFSVLGALRERLLANAEPAPEKTDLEALADAPHEHFSVDAAAQIHAAGMRLGRLTRGATLTLPDVRVQGLEELGAGARLRLQRRLLSFARDFVGRLLGRVRELAELDSPPLRALAYQLEQGLGTAPRNELTPVLAALTADEARELRRRGIELGYLSVNAPALLGRAALEQRRILVSVWSPDAALPPVLGRPSYASVGLSALVWNALGYVLLGPRAMRADLAERAARELLHGKDAPRALASFGVPRRENPRVARALERALVVAEPGSGS